MSTELPTIDDPRDEIRTEIEATDRIISREHRSAPRVRCTISFMRSYGKLIGAGLSHQRAAAILQVSRETVWRWRQQYPEFNEIIERETALAIAARLRVVNQACAAGDVQACRWFLERCHGGEYASKPAAAVQVNVGGELPSGVIVLPPKQIHDEQPSE